MRLVFIYLILLLIGTAVAFGIGSLVGLVWPSAKIPVFVIITVWWLWTGWRYAQWRDHV